MLARQMEFIPLGAIVLLLLTGGVALIGLAVVWRRAYVRGWRAARATPPTCSKCGYNLSGLTEYRCPECGSEFRLEELWKKAIYSTTLRRGPSAESPDLRPTSKENSTP